MEGCHGLRGCVFLAGVTLRQYALNGINLRISSFADIACVAAGDRWRSVPVQEGLLVRAQGSAPPSGPPVPGPVLGSWREMTHGMHLSRYTEASTAGIDLIV
jgi:hypothetical protein